MWMRNLVFLVTIGAGAAALGWLLFPTAVPPRGKDFNPNSVRDPEFTGVVREVDDLFAQASKAAGLNPAPEAPELPGVRRTALSLTERGPSVPAIRQYES